MALLSPSYSVSLKDLPCFSFLVQIDSPAAISRPRPCVTMVITMGAPLSSLINPRPLRILFLTAGVEWLLPTTSFALTQEVLLFPLELASEFGKPWHLSSRPLLNLLRSWWFFFYMFALKEIENQEEEVWEGCSQEPPDCSGWDKCRTSASVHPNSLRPLLPVSAPVIQWLESLQTRATCRVAVIIPNKKQILKTCGPTWRKPPELREEMLYSRLMKVV